MTGTGGETGAGTGAGTGGEILHPDNSAFGLFIDSVRKSNLCSLNVLAMSQKMGAGVRF